MSWKEDFIAKHGEEAYANRLGRRRKGGKNLPGGEKQRSQDRRDEDPKKWRDYDRAWREKNPQKIKEKGKKVSRKGGAYSKMIIKWQNSFISEIFSSHLEDDHKKLKLVRL